MDIKEKIKSLPATPGVYLFRDKAGALLYVGKAKNLKKRVSSYFQSSRLHAERIALMVQQVRDITFLPVSTEAEALIYENGLIKQLNPKYNVDLRDDKTYPIFKLTINEPYPQLFITRQRDDDAALYYGPFTDAGLLKQALVLLRTMFKLRRCATIQKRPCLYHHMKQCDVCTGEVTREEYAQRVRHLRLFLDGRRAELVRMLSGEMKAYAAGQEYEKAEAVRRQIEALGSIRGGAVVYGPRHELDELTAILGMAVKPERIEAFDISNTMGKEAVGSMVVFEDGRPKKSDYRRFRIRTVGGIDDYAMMREVIRRRYGRLVREDRALPSLILIDGGRGHLNAAAGELEKLGCGRAALISIAKEFEHVFRKGIDEPLILPPESKALHLLQRIRDEAHRFAIAYHKRLVSKKTRQSELDLIPGIGERRKHALLTKFGSVAHVAAASFDELARVEGMNARTAKNIIDHFAR